jgi:hypothetical protein
VLGVISLQGFNAITECQNKEIKRKFCFEIATPRRIYYLVAENRMEMLEWMEALQNIMKRSVGIWFFFLGFPVNF